MRMQCMRCCRLHASTCHLCSQAPHSIECVQEAMYALDKGITRFQFRDLNAPDDFRRSAHVSAGSLSGSQDTFQ